MSFFIKINVEKTGKSKGKKSRTEREKAQITRPMPRKVTIILLGDGSVGKSCMAIRYLNNEYLDAYDPTIQDTYRKTVMIDGEPVVTEIIDTSGQDEYYSNSIESLIMKGNGFLFVYNIVIPDSLEKLDLTIQNVFQLREATVKNPKGGMVICGNKCDRSNERKIPTEDGVQLAAKYDANFFESKILFFVIKLILFLYYN